MAHKIEYNICSCQQLFSTYTHLSQYRNMGVFLRGWHGSLCKRVAQVRSRFGQCRSRGFN